MTSSQTSTTAVQQVFIIEDNATTNELLCDWLKTHFHVIGYLDAESALKHLEAQTGPTLFIVDYNLPGMNGLELRHKLSPKYPTAKFILISGLFDEKLLSEARAAGYDATLPKPFAMPALLKKAQELFELPAPQPNLVEKIKHQN